MLNAATASRRSPHPPFIHSLMKLSLFSDYSLRVLMFAALKDQAFQIEEVTAAYGISRHHLAKVVQSLAKLGYLETRRGRGGGIQLAQNPQDIRVGKLVKETEHASAIVECFDPATNTCRLNGCCQLKAALAKAQDAFYESLNQLTLASLVTGPQRKQMIQNLLTDNTR